MLTTVKAANPSIHVRLRAEHPRERLWTNSPGKRPVHDFRCWSEKKLGFNCLYQRDCHGAERLCDQIIVHCRRDRHASLLARAKTRRFQVLFVGPISRHHGSLLAQRAPRVALCFFCLLFYYG